MTFYEIEVKKLKGYICEMAERKEPVDTVKKL